MEPVRLVLLLLVLGLPMIAGGCTDVPAFVFNPGEFNRSSPDFNKEPTDIETVTICYNRRVTPWEEVAGMARAECARVAKAARFTELNFLTCPVLVPGGAVFDCVGH